MSITGHELHTGSTLEMARANYGLVLDHRSSVTAQIEGMSSCSEPGEADP